MNCKDCYHYECHKHWHTGFEDFDELYNKENIEHICPEFKDKSSVIEKPDIVFQTDGVRIYKSKVKNVIFDTDGIAFDERAIGKSVFLYEEQAEKALERLENGN